MADANKISKIYPGALYRFNEIKNSSFIPYNQPLKRNSINMETNIFTEQFTGPIFTTINTFDRATINNQWVEMLRKKINGTTPADMSYFLTIIDSKEQIQHELGIMNTVDVNLEATLPLPSLPISLTPGLGVKTTNTSTVKSSIEKSKSTAVLKLEQVFYTSTVSQKANSNGGFLSIFQDNPVVDDDLMMISSVSYGRVFFVVFESDLSKGDLMKAISSKFETTPSLGVNITGAPIGGKADVGVQNERNEISRRTWDKTTINMKLTQWGGDVIKVSTKFEDILKEINKTNKFGPNNLGAPIRYTMVFTKDFADAYINVDTRYATYNCGKGTYNVDVKLKTISCKKADSDSPDVFGYVDVTDIKCSACTKKPDSEKTLWSRSEKNALEMSEGDKTTPNKTWSLHNLTYEELESLTFKLRVKLKEADLKYNDRFDCGEYIYKGTNGKKGEENNDEIYVLARGDDYKLNGEDKIITCKLDGNDTNSTIKAAFDIRFTANK